MRDCRFVAVHRGGPLELADHRLFATWAADCAEHVLPFFERHTSDLRPRAALQTARAWARGGVPVGDAQKAAVNAHAAARAMASNPAIAVARAAGHAAATAHMADHSLGAALYAVKAVKAVGGAAEVERAWQIEQLPHHLHELVISALAHKRLS